MKKITLFLCSILLMNACQKDDKNTLIVGTISGPETTVVEAAKAPLEKAGYHLKIKEFNDYLMPNLALSEGSLDANIYQHQPYLDKSNKEKGLALIAIGKTFIYPMAGYSKKIKNIDELKNNSIIAIPNDPSNETRALLLLEKAKLIKISKGSESSHLDISENPKNLIIKPIDAAQLPRALDDVDIAIINTTFAIPAGLNPQSDSIIIEDKYSPYANLIVVRQKDANSDKSKALLSAMHSKAVLNKAKDVFGNGALPAFIHDTTSH